MFPLFLNLAQRLAVVIGGGSVGRRKAQALLDAGASVRLVCLEPRPTEETTAALEWLTQPYHAGHLDGAALVFAAATSEVNRQIVADAHARGLWVNTATEPATGDFFMPAVLRRGDLTIAVGTQGAAPGLARAVRLLLEDQLDDAFEQWLMLLAELRPLLQDGIADPERRHAALRHLCGTQWLERLRRDGLEQVRKAMRREVQTLVEGNFGAV